MNRRGGEVILKNIFFLIENSVFPGAVVLFLLKHVSIVVIIILFVQKKIYFYKTLQKQIKDKLIFLPRAERTFFLMSTFRNNRYPFFTVF